MGRLLESEMKFLKRKDMKILLFTLLSIIFSTQLYSQEIKIPDDIACSIAQYFEGKDVEVVFLRSNFIFTNKHISDTTCGSINLFVFNKEEMLNYLKDKEKRKKENFVVLNIYNWTISGNLLTIKVSCLKTSYKLFKRKESAYIVQSSLVFKYKYDCDKNIWTYNNVVVSIF